MIQISEQPPIEVLASEYKRLLGLPPDFVIEGRLEELSDWARDWYDQHGRPWVYARMAESLDLSEGAVMVEGHPFRSERLAERLKQTQSLGCVLVAVTAGPETEDEARHKWIQEWPDEYYFLEMYASAVVEHLITRCGAEICAWADRQGWAVLPHYSPGYTGWDIEDQRTLFQLLAGDGSDRFEDRIGILPSGMLQPRKSQLALFALTEKDRLPTGSATAIPCESCSFSPCQFRRVPYKWRIYEEGTLPMEGISRENGKPVEIRLPLPSPRFPLNRSARYDFGTAVLDRWSRDRLRLCRENDGGWSVLFRYDGSTCNNSGYPILLDFAVRLGPGREGFPILAAACRPGEGDEGFERMCGALNDPGKIERDLESEFPLIGKPLDDILLWKPEAAPSGCLCNPPDRNHKWKIVLQTLHYGLVKSDESSS